MSALGAERTQDSPAHPLLAAWQARHPLVVGSVKEAGGLLTAVVLTEAQAQQAVLWARKHNLELSLTVLSRPEVPPPHGFALAPSLTSLFSAPDCTKLVTQWEVQDGPLRVLARAGSEALVQMQDLSLGWVHAAILETVEAPSAWPDRPLVAVGSAIPGLCPLGQLTAALMDWLHTPYLLGGRSRAAIDCSGLVSLAMRDVAGVALPRHSTDQLRCGTRVSLAALSPGHLLFARYRPRPVSHVGWVLAPETGGGPLRVMHASLGAQRVECQDLSAFLSDYSFMGARNLWAS